MKCGDVRKSPLYCSFKAWSQICLLAFIKQQSYKTIFSTGSLMSFQTLWCLGLCNTLTTFMLTGPGENWCMSNSVSSKMLLKVWHTLAAISIKYGIFLLRDDWTNITLVEQLSGAMSILSTIGKERGLLHTTEVAFPKYFTIYLFQNFLLVRSSH